MFAKLTFGLDRTPFGADFFCEPTHVTQIGQCHFAAVLGRMVSVHLTTCMLLFPGRNRHHQQVTVVRRVGCCQSAHSHWNGSK